MENKDRKFEVSFKMFFVCFGCVGQIFYHQISMENGYGYGYGYGQGHGYGYGDSDGHGLYRQGSGMWRSLRDGDFEEEDVWAVLRERKEYSNCKATRSNFEAQNSVKRSLPSAARMIPIGGSSSGNSNHHKSSESTRGVKQQSAPVSIPDWSKIYGKKSNKSFKVHDYDDDDDEHHDDDDDDDDVNDGRDSDDDDEDEDKDVHNAKMPPHEFIARRLARSQISSFSVFEGVGRTLKGRDLSKVRHAILTKTGFLETQPHAFP